MEQYLQETMPQNNISKEGEASINKWKFLSEATDESEERLSSGFDCNICLDTVQDPVVTLCGHLYCWPCIYKWIRQQTTSSEFPHEVHSQCPVCKSEISQTTIVPLYVPSSTSKPISKENTFDRHFSIPHRPSVPRCGVHTLSPDHQLHFHGFQQEVPNVISPISPTTGIFGEMVYERIFGNSETLSFTYPNSYSLAGMSTRRGRRQTIQAERSLSRICFFFFCCVMLCLILF